MVKKSRKKLRVKRKLCLEVDILNDVSVDPVHISIQICVLHNCIDISSEINMLLLTQFFLRAAFSQFFASEKD